MRTMGDSGEEYSGQREWSVQRWWLFLEGETKERLVGVGEI